MARYIDSATADPQDGLGAWLESNLVVGAEAFLAQSAWFSFGAIEPFADSITDLVDRDSSVHFVVGSNAGSLTKLDLLRLWELISSGSESRLTVIRYRNAVFHPKVFYVEREDGSKSAVVGSANLTPGGTEWNVEAGVILDTNDGDSDAALDDVRAAISAWVDRHEDGIFQVSDVGTVETLAYDGIIDQAQPKKEIEPEQPAGKATGDDPQEEPAKSGLRKRFWKPSKKAVEQEDQPEAPPPPAQAATAMQTGPAEERWAKKLKGTDAQQPPQPGTNPTGKLRLTRSGFDIDHTTYFRDVLFGDETWEAEVRTRNMTYEVAMVDFDVVFDGGDFGTNSLKVDHALHRVAGQSNVSTVLAWGSELGRELAQNSHVDEWVTIERFSGPSYKLTIQQDKPAWA